MDSEPTLERGSCAVWLKNSLNLKLLWLKQLSYVILPMPSGAPPTDERLASVILHGRGMMPANPLDDEQLQQLLAYLHTL